MKTKKLLALVLCALLALSCFGCAAPAAVEETPAAEPTAAAETPAPAADDSLTFTPGTYEGSAQGRNGPIKVAVTLSEHTSIPSRSWSRWTPSASANPRWKKCPPPLSRASPSPWIPSRA